MAAASPSSPLTVYEDASTFQALVWVPPDHTEQPLPVLIHLHGAGEAGRNVWGILAQGQTGTPLVELHHGRAPAALAQRFCVVGPQSPSSRWDESKVASFAAHLVTHPPVGVTVDASRVYIAGHSNGASAALGAGGLTMHVGGTEKRFAAIVPVAPGGCSRPESLSSTPVWIFHAVNDVVSWLISSSGPLRASPAPTGRVSARV